MIAVRRLNHAVLFVSDLDRAVGFYCNVLGMQVIAREPRANAAFLRASGSDNHHDLGLFGLGSAASGPPRGHGADPDGNEFEIMSASHPTQQATCGSQRRELDDTDISGARNVRAAEFTTRARPALWGEFAAGSRRGPSRPGRR